jgi:hypothetical protein
MINGTGPSSGHFTVRHIQAALPAAIPRINLRRDDPCAILPLPRCLCPAATVIDNSRRYPYRNELSPNFGDGRDQAAAA